MVLFLSVQYCIAQDSDSAILQRTITELDNIEQIYYRLPEEVTVANALVMGTTAGMMVNGELVFEEF